MTLAGENVRFLSCLIQTRESLNPKTIWWSIQGHPMVELEIIILCILTGCMVFWTCKTPICRLIFLQCHLLASHCTSPRVKVNSRSIQGHLKVELEIIILCILTGCMVFRKCKTPICRLLFLHCLLLASHCTSPRCKFNSRSSQGRTRNNHIMHSNWLYGFLGMQKSNL